MTEYTITIAWDDEARVWYAVCDEIPLALESESLDTLIERVKIATPEMLELNDANVRCNKFQNFLYRLVFTTF